MPAPLDLPLIGFSDAAAWSDWLSVHHADPKGVWLRLAKVVVPDPCLRYAAAVEVALQWGWIDGQVGKLDEREFRQRFTPRRPASLWSKVNTAKATALIDAGRMFPPGLREVEAAKADGRWHAAYTGSREATVPEDLVAALAASPGAEAFFASLDAANRYAVLWRLQTARTPETRTRRLTTLVDMLARGERIHEKRGA